MHDSLGSVCLSVTMLCKLGYFRPNTAFKSYSMKTSQYTMITGLPIDHILLVYVHSYN